MTKTNKVHRCLDVEQATSAPQAQMPMIQTLNGALKNGVVSQLSLEEIMSKLKEKLESDGHTFSESTASSTENMKLTCDIKENTAE